MYQIVLIICYFGKLPAHFPWFLHSCGKNPTIRFLLFSDCASACTLPENVTLVQTDFPSLRQRIQENFPFPIRLNSPYKICDYRPAYGYIFEPEICGYDFWGYCDIDLLFGDIRRFATDDVLAACDKLYQFGHLTLIRNTQANNRVFMLPGSPEYRDAFTTDINTVFDEVAGIHKKFLRAGLSVRTPRDYADITPRFHRFRLSDAWVDIPQNNHKDQIFTYEDGRVFRYYAGSTGIVREEFNYIHFQKRRMNTAESANHCCFVTNRGLIPMEAPGCVSLADMRRYNGTRPVSELVHRLRHLMWRVQRKLRKLRGLGG